MIFVHLGLGNYQAYSQLFGLGMGIQDLNINLLDWEWKSKIKFPIFSIRNVNENLIPNMWEWEFASHFQKGENATGNFKIPPSHLALC